MKLKTKLSKLRHDGHITDAEYAIIINVLNKFSTQPPKTQQKVEQPCEDAISREAVRRILANQRDELVKLHTVNPKDNPKADAMAYGVNWSLNTLMELPSVKPSYNSIKIELEPCEDCVSREEAIRIAEQGQIQGYEWQFKKLCNLPSVTPWLGWIPVSERLPETDGVYSVTRRLFDNQIDTEPYYMVDACYFDGSNTWHDDNRINHERSYLTDIIAWMPRPQPYEVESEE